jgi:hypothetical protein
MSVLNEPWVRRFELTPRGPDSLGIWCDRDGVFLGAECALVEKIGGRYVASTSKR